MLTSVRAAFCTWAPPSGHDVKTVQAGVHWLAVRVPESTAETALSLLGDRTGSVIHDPFTRCCYWLVPLGTSADGWDLPGVHVLGTCSWVAVPPRHWISTPGLRWAREWRTRQTLTEADDLRAALVTAASCNRAAVSM